MLLCLCLSLCCFHLLLYLSGSGCQLRDWELGLGSKSAVTAGAGWGPIGSTTSGCSESGMCLQLPSNFSAPFPPFCLLLILYCSSLGLSLAFPTGPSLHSPLLSCSLPCCLWKLLLCLSVQGRILFYLLGPLWQGPQGTMNRYTRNAQEWNVSTKKAPPAANRPQSSSMGKQFASGFPKADPRKG